MTGYYVEYDEMDDSWEVYDLEDFWVASFDDREDAQAFVKWKEREYA